MRCLPDVEARFEALAEELQKLADEKCKILSAAAEAKYAHLVGLEICLESWTRTQVIGGEVGVSAGYYDVQRIEATTYYQLYADSGAPKGYWETKVFAMVRSCGEDKPIDAAWLASHVGAESD